MFWQQKTKQFVGIDVGEGQGGKRPNHTLISVSERNIIRSCPKFGSLEAEPVLGNSCASGLLQGEGRVGWWGEVKRRGALHWRLASTRSHRELRSMRCPGAAPHCPGADLLYPCVSQPLAVRVLEVRCG